VPSITKRGRYEEQITSTIGIASNEQYSPQLADFNPHTYYTSIRYYIFFNLIAQMEKNEIRIVHLNLGKVQSGISIFEFMIEQFSGF
jgi:hypothetical protein